MKIKNKIHSLIEFLEKGQFDLKTWLITFSALISTRLLIESLLLGFPEKSLESFLSLVLHTFSFFLLTYLVFLIFLVYLTGENFKKIASFLLWGFGIIIFPPIVDKIFFQGEVYKSFYIFDSLWGFVIRFFTFFGENPDWGITWGSRVNILISTISLGFYVYFKTKSKKRVLIGLIGGYFLFFVLSAFPSVVVYVLEIKNILKVSYATVAGYFMSPFSVFNLETFSIEAFLAKKLALIYLPLNLFLLLFFSFKLNFNKTVSLLNNIRYPQSVFNVGLLFIGLGLGFFYNQEVFIVDVFSILTVLNLILITLTAWFFSVFINDLSDLEVDKISNKNRPLIKKEFSQKEYKNYAYIIFWFSILSSLAISPVIFLIIVCYHLLTWVYSCYPFRLKRFLGVAGCLISLSSLNFLVIGFLVFVENQTLTNFPWTLYWFLFVAYLLTTPLKDLRDLEGDKKNKTYTLPVLIGRKNTRLVVASCIFSFYLLSVYVLNKQELFLAAILFGGSNFMIINNLKIDEKKLNSLVLGLAFFYGCLVVRIIFF